jgi:hypothetical protein
MCEPYYDPYHEFLAKVPSRKLTKLLARYELFQRVLELPGDLVECGVCKGAGILLWAQLLQIFNPLSCRRVIGFDTFNGFPAATLTYSHDRESTQRIHQLDSTLTQTTPDDILTLATRQGVRERIELVEGDATTTISRYVRQNAGFRIALLNLDFDTYDPTLTALEHFYPLVVPGGVIVLDEYGLRGFGESDAVDAYFQDKPVVYQQLPWAKSPRAYLIKR